MLVYESMLTSVVIARDKWLKPVRITSLELSFLLVDYLVGRHWQILRTFVETRK